MALTKSEIINTIQMLDTLDPSEFYCSISEQYDQEDAEWTLRYSYDGGNEMGRILTNKQLREMALKALAYEDLKSTIGDLSARDAATKLEDEND